MLNRNVILFAVSSKKKDWWLFTVVQTVGNYLLIYFQVWNLNSYNIMMDIILNLESIIVNDYIETQTQFHSWNQKMYKVHIIITSFKNFFTLSIFIVTVECKQNMPIRKTTTI